MSKRKTLSAREDLWLASFLRRLLRRAGSRGCFGAQGERDRGDGEHEPGEHQQELLGADKRDDNPRDQADRDDAEHARGADRREQPSRSAWPVEIVRERPKLDDEEVGDDLRPHVEDGVDDRELRLHRAVTRSRRRRNPTRDDVKGRTCEIGPRAVCSAPREMNMDERIEPAALIVKSKVKTLFSEAEMRVSDEAWNEVGHIVTRSVKAAIRRAKANGRKTVKAADF